MSDHAINDRKERLPNPPAVDGERGANRLLASASSPPAATPVAGAVPGGVNSTVPLSAAKMSATSQKSSSVIIIPTSSSISEVDAGSNGAGGGAVSSLLTGDEVDAVVVGTCFGVGVGAKSKYGIDWRRGLWDRKLLQVHCFKMCNELNCLGLAILSFWAD